MYAYTRFIKYIFTHFNSKRIGSNVVIDQVHNKWTLLISLPKLCLELSDFDSDFKRYLVQARAISVVTFQAGRYSNAHTLNNRTCIRVCVCVCMHACVRVCACMHVFCVTEVQDIFTTCSSFLREGN